MLSLALCRLNFACVMLRKDKRRDKSQAIVECILCPVMSTFYTDATEINLVTCDI